MRGRPERANRQQRLTGPEQARDTVDPRALDRLIQRHRRENSGKPLRQHRLAGSWRTDQQHVVPAGRRHLQRPFRMVLAAHLRKIRHAGKGLMGGHRAAVERRQRLGAREVLEDLWDGRDRIHGHVFHDGRFTGILDRHEQPLAPSTAAGQRHREHAVDGLDAPL